MGYYISYEDDRYILLCVRQGVLAGAEEIEYRVDEDQGYRHEDESDYRIQCNYVAKYLVGSLVVLLAEKYGEHGRRSGTYQGSESCRKVHQRECDRQAGNGKRTYTLSDEYAVDHIIQGRCGLCDDGRQGILLEQSAYLFCTKLGRDCVFGFCHFVIQALLLPRFQKTEERSQGCFRRFLNIRIRSRK